MSNGNGTQSAVQDEPTIAQIVERTQPMGNLHDLVIVDLTEVDEDAYFRGPRAPFTLVPAGRPIGRWLRLGRCT